MPWNLAVCVLVFAGGCLFSADYGGGQFRCSDGRCPSGLVCSADQRCIASPVTDAPAADASDGPVDAIDARLAALTCADPGVVAATGGSEPGTTAGRTSTISSSCGGFVMNGADAVYRLTAALGDSYLIGITGVKAYVIAPCSVSPATPVCLGNTFASPGNPISITTTFAGQHFIVVDHENAATTGAYTLTVTKQ
ncbi:MAG: hypothetical protein IPQ07_22320 [Myxococcales bacterium]|nr:hypothetical protein [Myxococcales bacterium]